MAFLKEMVTAGGLEQQIPPQAPIANAGLDDQHRVIQHMAHDVAKLQLRPDIALDSQPLIAQGRHLVSSVYDLHIAYIASLGPVTLIIDQMPPANSMEPGAMALARIP